MPTMPAPAPRRRATAAAFAHALTAVAVAVAAREHAAVIPADDPRYPMQGAVRQSADRHAARAGQAAAEALGRAWQPDPGPTPPSTQAWNAARRAHDACGDARRCREYAAANAC